MNFPEALSLFSAVLGPPTTTPFPGGALWGAVDAPPAVMLISYANVRRLTVELFPKGVDYGGNAPRFDLAESTDDLAGCVLRGDLGNCATIMPAAILVEAARRCMGLARLTLSDVNEALADVLWASDGSDPAHGARWHLDDGRVVQTAGAADGTVTVTFCDGHGLEHAHVIAETTDTPGAVHALLPASMLLRNDKPCTLADAMEAAAGFLRSNLPLR